MKYLLTLLFTMVAFSGLYAQSQADLIPGTWHIQQFQYSNHPDNNEKNSRYDKYKMFTATHFSIVEVDRRSNLTTTSIFGTYTFKEGIYSETILNVNSESAAMLGKTFNYTLDFEGEDVMYQTGSFNGMKISERWIRLGMEPKPLVYLKVDGKDMELKTSDKFGPAMSSIVPDHIASIEVIKGVDATQKFGSKAAAGIVIITLKPEFLATTLEKLKVQQQLP